MDKSGRVPSSRRLGSARGQEDPSPAPPRRAAALPSSADVENAGISRRTTGGKRVLLPDGRDLVMKFSVDSREKLDGAVE